MQGSDGVPEHAVRPVTQRPWSLLTILVMLAGLAAWLLQSKLLGLMPPCMLHRYTGILCPGCGGRRCVMMLAEGRWLDALRMNVLLILVGVGFSVLLLRESWREWRGGKSFVLTPRMGWAIVYGIFGFWLLRNIPAWPFNFLAPFSL